MTFGFPKVKWLQYTGEVGKCTSYWCQIFSGFNTQKIIKIVTFWQSYLKNKKVEVFGDTVYIIVLTVGVTICATTVPPQKIKWFYILTHVASKSDSN